MTDRNKIFENNRLLDFIVNPKKRIYRHLLMFLFLALLMHNNSPTPPGNMEPDSTLLIFGVVVLCVCIGIIYLNLYFLVPRLLFKNNYGRYFLSVFLISTLLFLVFFLFILASSRFSSFDREVMQETDNLSFGIGGYVKAYLSFLLIYGSFLGTSTAIKLFQRWIIDKSRIYELENSTIQSELEQLKNQITPHFLFNTLNNTNVLIATDPEKASQVVLMLSDLLRYQLYDSARPAVLLASDIRFLTDFLELEKIRRDRFEFSISNNSAIPNLLVPPMLFIPFVENAMKHSAGGTGSSYVHVTFRTVEKALWFSCVNSIPADISTNSKTAGGIGLANVKRRLELLYGENFSLEMSKGKNSYHVNLQLKLCGVS
ncbi:MAG: histidine kinase [Prevotellaceae bacterium]|jgi:sensor histidine kinase YesM|nr:histidine kinase [Prevotellaceae bacterium]